MSSCPLYKSDSGLGCQEEVMGVGNVLEELPTGGRFNSLLLIGLGVRVSVPLSESLEMLIGEPNFFHGRNKIRSKFHELVEVYRMPVSMDVCEDSWGQLPEINFCVVKSLDTLKTIFDHPFFINGV